MIWAFFYFYTSIKNLLSPHQNKICPDSPRPFAFQFEFYGQLVKFGIALSL